MNIEVLKNAERNFRLHYPEGFESKNMQEMKRKHKFGSVVKFAQEVFTEDSFKHKKQIIDNISRFVSKSSMVSVFEKIKFRNFLKEIDDELQFELVDSIYELIHGNEKRGFTKLVQLLSTYNLAKWPLITCYLAYLNPKKDVFVKPTTVKLILKKLEITHITYSPKPTYEFYKEYRKVINSMKKHVDKRLWPSNPAFSGFLMMSL